MTEIEEANKHIDAAMRIARKSHKRATALLKQVQCSVVQAKRLEALEALAVAVQAAVDTAKMTRDYSDVSKLYPDDESYNGKRFLIRRNEGNEMLKALRNVNDS